MKLDSAMFIHSQIEARIRDMCGKFPIGNLLFFQKQASPDFTIRSYPIYAGAEDQERSAASVRSWLHLKGIF